MLDNKIKQFYQRTKSADFCTTDDRFLWADFIGRQNRPTLSIVWHPLYCSASSTYWRQWICRGTAAGRDVTQIVEQKLLALLNFDGVAATQLSDVGDVMQRRHCTRECTVGRHKSWVQCDQLHTHQPRVQCIVLLDGISPGYNVISCTHISPGYNVLCCWTA